MAGAGPLGVGDGTLVAIAIGGMLVMVVIFMVMLKNRYVKVGPNEALIVSGWAAPQTDSRGRRVQSGVTIVIGGGTFVWPIFQKAEVLSLEIMTVDLPGFVAQVRVARIDEAVERAARSFLTKTHDEVLAIVRPVLEARLREAPQGATDDAAKAVRDTAGPDLAAMGLEIVALTVKTSGGTQGHRDASTEVTAAKILEDGARKRAEMEALVTQAERDYEERRAKLQIEIAAKKAEADLAYDMAAARVRQEALRQGAGTPCTACRALVPEHDKFCWSCGQARA